VTPVFCDMCLPTQNIRQAEFRAAGGCLGALHVSVHHYCGEHSAMVWAAYSHGQVYCAECHSQAQEWGKLVPLDDLIMEPYEMQRENLPERG
jgi:hypothetical protein